MTLTLNQLAIAIIVLVVMGITIGFSPSILEASENVFSALGITKEKTKTNIETNSKYITIIGAPEEINKEKTIYGKDPNDWVGVDDPQLNHNIGILLEFDKTIDHSSASCIQIWQSKEVYYRTPPSLRNEWEPIKTNFISGQSEKTKEEQEKERKKKIDQIISDHLNIKIGDDYYTYDEKGWIVVSSAWGFKSAIFEEVMKKKLLNEEDLPKLDILNAKKENNVWIIPIKYVSIEAKKLTLSGFKEGGWGNYAYLVKFQDCFKSTDEKPINPQSAIVKFSID